MFDEIRALSWTDRTSDCNQATPNRIEIDLITAMDALFDMAAVVDSSGLVVMANEQFKRALRIGNRDGIVGRRIGAIAHCSRHISSCSGCGKTVGCGYCGVNKAIIECFANGRVATGEASLVLNEKADLVGLNFAVRVTPLLIAGARYAFVILHDISAQKTKAYINSKLIHFLVDQICGINGLSGFLADNLGDVVHRDLALCIVGASGDALNLLQEYQQLVDAEAGDVKPVCSDILVRDLAEKLKQLGKSKLNVDLSVDYRCAADSFVHSDLRLLEDSLVYIVKCAAESLNSHRVLHLRISQSRSSYIFAVHHRSVLDTARKYATFLRWGESDTAESSSLCAYLSRLYLERYLGGSVSCRSSEQFGTVYTVQVPKHSKSNVCREVA